MKKIILGVLVFVLLILSTTVLAQTKLDPNIYDENGFRLDQDIPKPISPPDRPSTTSASTTSPTPQPKSNVNTEAFKQGEPASCFDYYTFGSIGVNPQTDTSSYTPGDPVLIRGQITNNNRYPVTNLTIRARLVRDIPNPVYMRSEIITVDDFNIAENITLNASSTFDIKYSHLLPLNAPKGEYKIFFYAYNNDRFNQAGLSFTNDIVASRISFDVTGKNPQQVYLDQTQIELNDQIHNVMAFMTQHEMNAPINVSIPLVNPSSQDEEMSVTYTLYKWDGLREENIVDTKTETVTVPAKGEVKLTYSANKTDTSVYFLNITADNKTQKRDRSVYNIKTESNIRFVVNGYDFPRINSFGVDQYPIKAGQEATLFTCYHNGASQDTIHPVNISTTLFDDKGKEIAKTEYDGKIGGAISAIVKKFTLKKDLVNFKTVTTLKDNTGEVIDTIENEYNCKDINPTLCPQPINLSWTWMLLGLLVLIAIILVIRKMKSKMNIPMVMFVLVILIVPMVGQKAEAAVVTDSKTNNIYCISACGEPDTQYNTEVKGLAGDIVINFYKNFNLKTQSDSNVDPDFSLNIGEKVKSISATTTGDWFFQGGIFDSPPADGRDYVIGKIDNRIYVADVKKPYDKNNFLINSSDSSVVSCDVSGCVGLKAGTSNITVSFPNNPTVPQPTVGCTYGILPGFTKQECINWILSDAYGMTTGNITKQYEQYVNYFSDGHVTVDFGQYLSIDSFPRIYYSFPSITYTVTVPPVANTPQTTSCSSIDPGTESATINWSYSDTDGDVQDGYQVQLATSLDFDNDTIFAATGVSSITSVTLPNPVTVTDKLTKNVTYYARVRTHNSTNDWSAWTDANLATACQSFKTSDSDSLSISCSPLSVDVTIPEGANSVTQVLSSSVQYGEPLYTFKWFKGLAKSLISGATSGSYTATISRTDNPSNPPSSKTWSIPFYVNVTDSGPDSATSSACNINVTDDNLKDQCDNIDGDQFTVPALTDQDASNDCYCKNGKNDPPTCVGVVTPPDFYFSPNIAGANESCPFYLSISGVSQCELHNRLGNISAGPFGTTSPDTILFDLNAGKTAPIGTHSLWCNTPDDSTFNPYGVARSCFSESNVKEN